MNLSQVVKNKNICYVDKKCMKICELSPLTKLKDLKILLCVTTKIVLKK